MYFSFNYVCKVKEDIYDEVDFQLVLLAKLEALSKQNASLTLVPINVNPVRALQCDLYGEGHANGHCVQEG